MTRKGIVISIRISESVHKIWKEAIDKRRKEVKKIYPDADISESSIIADLMIDWAKKELNTR